MKKKEIMLRNALARDIGVHVAALLADADLKTLHLFETSAAAFRFGINAFTDPARRARREMVQVLTENCPLDRRSL